MLRCLVPVPDSEDSALIIGDVHGCVDELAALVERVGDPGRAIILVGDLVAKGPDSKGVLAFVRDKNARSVLGNHDAHALRYLSARTAGEEPPLRSDAHKLMCESFDDADWALLTRLPTYLRYAEDRAVVHGGAVPGIALKAQERKRLLNLRSIRPDGTPTKKLDGTPWAQLWSGPEHLTFGHDAVRGLQRESHAVGLDTGCVYGGELTGLLYPEDQIVSVSAKRVYAEIG